MTSWPFLDPWADLRYHNGTWVSPWCALPSILMWNDTWPGFSGCWDWACTVTNVCLRLHNFAWHVRSHEKRAKMVWYVFIPIGGLSPCNLFALHSDACNPWGSLCHCQSCHYACMPCQFMCQRQYPPIYPANTYLHTTLTLKLPTPAPIHIFETVQHLHKIGPTKPIIRMPVSLTGDMLAPHSQPNTTQPLSPVLPPLPLWVPCLQTLSAHYQFGNHGHPSTISKNAAKKCHQCENCTTASSATPVTIADIIPPTIIAPNLSTATATITDNLEYPNK